jgi:Tfp pilus assembly protein PilF
MTNSDPYWQEQNEKLIALINERKVEEAVVLGQTLVTYVDRKFKKDAKEKATAYNNLGMAFMLARDYALAEECLRDALAMRKRIWGDNHNEVAVVLLNLVQLYRIQAQEILALNRINT